MGGLAEQMDIEMEEMEKVMESSEEIEQKEKEDFVTELLSQMSLSEKIGQMAQVDINALLTQDDNGVSSINQELAKVFLGQLGVGSVLNVPTSPPSHPWNVTQWRTNIATLHKITKSYHEAEINQNGDVEVSSSKPMIPILYGLDSIHGANYVYNAILSPQPINIASTFDSQNAYEAGLLASRDTRAAGVPWIFAPLLGISLHPFWPRVYETFGEDPFLVSRMGVAMIQGIQYVNHENEEEKGNISHQNPSRAAACAKHFIGYSMPRTGHDRSPAWIPPRHLYNYFVPPFRQAISKCETCGNVMTVMESYSEYDGVPMASNREALQTLLRQTLNFEGMLVTDFQEVENLQTWHKVAQNEIEAVQLMLQETSIDMSMVPYDITNFIDRVKILVKEGRVDEKRIDESVRRILKLKKALGLFEEVPNFDVMDDVNVEKVGSDEDRTKMLQMARESIVLVKNNDNTLPILSKSSDKESLNIFVTGPTMNSLRYMSGGWTLSWQGPDDDSQFTYGTTVLDAILQNEKEDNHHWNVTHSCGATLLGEPCLDSDSHKLTSIDKTAQKASDADYIIICVGEKNYAEKPGDAQKGLLPPGQYELVQRIREAVNEGMGGKIILVYFGGRPRLLETMVENSDAILIAFLPGPDGGQAVADIIKGDMNPSGRLPITYPKFTDGAGSPYFHAISEKCTYHLCEVQWPFGYGLSYTSFEYTHLSASSRTIVYDPFKSEKHANKRQVSVSVTVTNIGNIPGSDVVMFFTFDHSRHVTPEYKRLRYFERVYLNPKQSKVVKMKLDINDLRYVGPHDETHSILQPGMEFQIGVGLDTCRLEDTNEPHPEKCTETIKIESKVDYIDYCDVSCSIWNESGCGNEFNGFDSETCWNMCLAEKNLGWGWNYANCIETISKQISQSKNNEECWKMNTFCRDIFRGRQKLSLSKYSFSNQSFLILFASLSCVFVIMMLILRSTKSKKQQSHDEIEFTEVNSDVYQ